MKAHMSIIGPIHMPEDTQRMKSKSSKYLRSGRKMVATKREPRLLPITLNITQYFASNLTLLDQMAVLCSALLHNLVMCWYHETVSFLSRTITQSQFAPFLQIWSISV